MPSPVTMPALVFCRKTRPAPPVRRITALRFEQAELAGGDLDGEHAAHAAVLDHQIGAEELVVAP